MYIPVANIVTVSVVVVVVVVVVVRYVKLP